MIPKSDKGNGAKRTAVNLEVGTSVRVTSGPHTDVDGQITEVNADQGKAAQKIVAGTARSMGVTIAE